MVTAGSHTHAPEPRNDEELLDDPDTASLDVVLPVHNAERSLADRVHALHAYLTEHVPLDWTITIVDTASTDATARIAADLARTTPGLRVLRTERKGRGLAVRTAWERSEADIAVHLDADPGLEALAELIAPLSDGRADLTVGVRPTRTRGRLLRLTHGVELSDASCGITAIRTDVVRPVLARSRDEGSFFDTELLLLAEHNGLRIQEVPLAGIGGSRWRLGTLVGLVAVARRKANGAAGVPGFARSDGERGQLLWQVLCFGVIGVISTVANLAMYALLRLVWPVLPANLVSLLVPTLFNTEANRRLTFDGAPKSVWRTHLEGLVVFVLYYAFTSGALLGLDAVVPNPSTLLELTVLVVSSAIGTAARFLAFRWWMFQKD